MENPASIVPSRVTGKLPPSPWKGRDLLLGAAISATLVTAFDVVVWRQSIVGNVSDIAVDFAGTGVLVLLVFLPVWALTARRKGSLKDIFLQPVAFGVVLFTVLGTLLFTVVDGLVWSLVDAAFETPSQGYWWGRESAPGGFEMASLVFTAVLVDPVIEEVLWRGIVLRYLGSVMKPAVSVAVTAFLFAVWHFQPIGIPNRFIFGLAAGGLVYGTRSLYPAIAFHITVNALGLMTFAA